jgi:guanylate kinase
MRKGDQNDNVLAVKALQQQLAQDPGAFAVVVAGPSGVGKTTLCRRVLDVEKDVRRCVTTTTRPPRAEEKEGVERHFVSHSEFLKMIKQGAFIEHAEVHGQLYGASLEAVYAAMKDGRVMLMDVDVQGVVTWQKALGDRCVTIFVLPPSVEKLEERLASRQTETGSEFQLRMKNAIKELRQASLCDYIIINAHLLDTVEHLRGIIQAERHRASRMQMHLSDLGLIEGID